MTRTLVYPMLVWTVLGCRGTDAQTGLKDDPPTASPQVDEGPIEFSALTAKLRFLSELTNVPDCKREVTLTMKQNADGKWVTVAKHHVLSAPPQSICAEYEGLENTYRMEEARKINCGGLRYRGKRPAVGSEPDFITITDARNDECPSDPSIAGKIYAEMGKGFASAYLGTVVDGEQ